ncbi:NAD(P)/FAD-dependent oxidoreductase [Puniceibacterium sediminis]|uniref:3-phenylpropionate/trans-cinnamate dioxygenase ferredoxin reductase subunit n=1 Tax=Puniceibacterium sediminis TaxID=1608407 RepID=A0A238WRN0_9RHOB|nr:FAD-dependent oxidoreductase [Puniceibacterium sediminis]SNR49172.1 3-phenylpropionate/trans-cinnamate dioxygenase ferredoxin reductase subunit [Puniceibacterium sediminis]
MSKVVVIGAGQAGSALVARLRKQGFDGNITLVGDEPVPPYQRPPLSKAYLLGEMEQERLYLRPASYYSDQNIDLRTGARAADIDADARTVSLPDGVVLPYDHLVLATGSTPRRLPAAIGGDLDGVFTVRTLADVDTMAPRFTAGAKVLIVGGGYIGLEAAAVARKLGLEVVLIEMADRILQRVAAPETSDYFRVLHQSHGVTLREGVGLSRLLGEDRVTGAELTNGERLEADFVIVGVGITPVTDLAEQAGIALENGIRTDSFGRTSDPAIWAAGDCASFPWNGTRIRLESVGNAIDQAECVADNIMGANVPYTAKPWFWSDQFDVKLQIAGLNTGYDTIVTRKTPEGASGSHTGGVVSFWYYRGETLLALDAMNDPRAYMVGKRLIEAGKSPAPSAVSDPATDLKDLLKA